MHIAMTHAAELHINRNIGWPDSWAPDFRLLEITILIEGGQHEGAFTILDCSHGFL
jgi:hypothetical protein